MKARSPLFIIFTTVAVDLLGFGIVIPLVALYGKHFNATAGELALLGAIYSLTQFLFAPFWGSLSDRIGRRPVLLISLTGSTASYFIFGFASSYWWLFASRALGGLFAANISAAQAYIADITPHEKRTHGMALIGAAFGLGFTLGPPIGGLAAYKLGLGAPGFIAGTICGLNLLLAIFRLPESLPVENRHADALSYKPLNPEGLRIVRESTVLLGLVGTFFFSTFAFSHFEQTFALLFREKFNLDVQTAGLQTGKVLLWIGVVGVIVQGFFVRKALKRVGDYNMLLWGLFMNGVAIAVLPFGPTYGSYFIFALPLALGSGLVNPALTGLISKSTTPSRQGAVLGLNQGLGSLARALGPASGLLAFSADLHLPFLIGGGLFMLLFLFNLRRNGAAARASA